LLIRRDPPASSLPHRGAFDWQVELLRAALEDERQVAASVGEGPALEVGTVDGFQGREKEAIVISLVRSNDRHEVGLRAVSPPCVTTTPPPPS